MKLILSIFKWIVKILVGFIILLLISAACFRIFASKPIAPGELVDVNGTKLHIRAEGEKNDLPTLVLECGAGGNTDAFHWIAEGLKNKMRVVRYDREGKAFSESTKDSITAELYARQLHALLEENGEQPPYILGAHSMGGPYIRIFRDLYPDEVKAMVFLDASHPEQWERLGEEGLLGDDGVSAMKYRAILGDLGIFGIYNILMNPQSLDADLPQELQDRKLDLMLYSGDVFRRLVKENSINGDILLRASQAKDLDSLPVLVYTATKQYGNAQAWFEMQKELKDLSANGKHYFMDANHGSLITKKENADIITKEILVMAEAIKDQI